MRRSLRILSVVTLVTPLGEYGGPVRVAMNQAEALAALGHEVTLAGSHRGWGAKVPTELQGVRAELFPARELIPGIGFAGLASPGLLRWVAAHLRDFDVVHVHAARDLVTLPVAMLCARRHKPYVLQTHGMIDPSDRRLAALLDATITRRVLRGARHVLHLTPEEEHGLQHVCPGLRSEHLPNGVPAPGVIAEIDGSQVLYMARLAARKRPQVFVRAAQELAVRYPDVEFVMVGADEGEGGAVRNQIAQARAAGARVGWDGAVPPAQTLEAMGRASVYVLPAIDEPYPMSVLEAMSVGLPVVVTDSCGLAPAVREASAGIVVGSEPGEVADAVAVLLDDLSAARASGRRGREHVREHLTMDRIAKRLSELYAY